MSRPKILLADDSITIQKVVNLTFADQGMDVVAFADGDAAVEHLDEIKPDIVLADVNMPGINGYQLCELIRSDDANKNTPVVLLVGSFEPFDRDEAERVGSNTYLTKPFTSIADLIATVQGLLDRKTETEPIANGSQESSEEQSEQPAAPRPDTSDIDSLYEQSFVETVELPRTENLNGGFGNDLDDEMIQTSYAEPDPVSPDDEDTYFAIDSEDHFSEVPENDDEAESLIAESMPPQDESVSETQNAEPDHGIESEPEQRLDAEPEPDWQPYESHEQVQESPVEASDPFESIAAEPPPVEPSFSPAASSDEDISTVDTARFNFDDDLLEIPGSNSQHQTAAAGFEEPAAKPQQITELSPELIDLIVEKVVERLANKY